MRVRGMIKECCVCRKRERDGAWRPEQGVAGERVSHGYCPACYEEFMERLELLFLARGRVGRQAVAAGPLL